MPKINEEYLMDIGKPVNDRAKKLFDIVVLNNIPISSKDKDKRWTARKEVLGVDESFYDDWLAMKDTSFEKRSINGIINCAIKSVFFQYGC